MKFLRSHVHVIAIDGILDRTGGKKSNLPENDQYLTFIDKRIEDVNNLSDIIDSTDLIISSMGWTSHIDSISCPFYDLELNTKSHITLVNTLKDFPNKQVIYLGSRGQYGKQNQKKLYENGLFSPSDVQGINKVASEYYYKIYSDIFNFNAISIRFPACFGRNQMVDGDDIGLIGLFIRNAIAEKNIEIFGTNRTRNFIYIDDLVNTIFMLSQKNFIGFLPLNINGYSIKLTELAKKVVKYCGSGKVLEKRLPSKIKSIDIGDSQMSERNLIKTIGAIKYTEFDISIPKTIKYFREQLDD